MTQVQEVAGHGFAGGGLVAQVVEMQSRNGMRERASR